MRRIPMLFQHDPAEPIGVWLELREDSRGLYARGRLIPEVQRGRELLALVQGRRDRRAVDRLSHREGPRRSAARASASSTQLDLWEISIVTFPLLAGARVRAVKDAGAAAHGEGDRHERLFRRYPRFSFARTKAEAGVEGDLARRSARAGARPTRSRVAPAALAGGITARRVQRRRQAPPSRRDRRIRGWIADSALRAMADRKAAFARPAR